MARYIDAEKAVMTALSLTRLYDSDYQRGFYDGMDRTLEIIADEPTADVAEVKRGEWIYEPRTFNCNAAFKCSACGHREYEHDRKTKYCPNCGALNKGEGGKQDECD